MMVVEDSNNSRADADVGGEAEGGALHQREAEEASRAQDHVEAVQWQGAGLHRGGCPQEEWIQNTI